MNLRDICYEIGYSFYKAINGGYYQFILTDNVLWIIDTWNCTEDEMMEIYNANKVSRSNRSIVCRFNEDGTIKNINNRMAKYKKYFPKLYECYKNKTVVILDSWVC